MILLLTIAAIVSRSQALSQVPIVGILSEPFISEDNNTDYIIAASYVKWLEVSGARSIPIPHDASYSQINDIFDQIDGVLFPGGAGKSLPLAARHIWQLAKEENARDGGFFPIWGTCLGFEYLLMLGSENETILEGGFDAENISLPLHLYPQVSSHSKLYSGIERLVQTHNVTLNNHMFGITPHRFQTSLKLTSLFEITSLNFDRQGRPFVSTIEPVDPKSNPYYGVQYHPEKNAFEYATYPDSNFAFEAIDHSPHGLMLTIHLGRFFVNLTRQSQLARGLRSHRTVYPPVYSYTRRVGIKFQEYYIIRSTEEMIINEQRL